MLRGSPTLLVGLLAATNDAALLGNGFPRSTTPLVTSQSTSPAAAALAAALCCSLTLQPLPAALAEESVAGFEEFAASGGKVCASVHICAARMHLLNIVLDRHSSLSHNAGYADESQSELLL